MGLLEILNTISNPPIYKEAITSMMYLLNFSFGTPDTFIRKLFTIKSFNDIIQVSEKLNEMLQVIADDAKKTKIQDDEAYGIKKVENFVNWITILGNDKLINEAEWLTSVLGLTRSEIKSLLGQQSYLFKNYTDFNTILVTDFGCPQTPCGNEIIYHQLIDQTVTSKVGKADLKELLLTFNPQNFPFNISPEMKHYYEQVKQQPSYDQIKLTPASLGLMFDSNSQYVLMEPLNLITLLRLNQTKDLNVSSEYYQVQTIEQLNFVISYIFNFLPDTFLYSSIDNTYKIDSLAKAYSSIIKITVDNTYGKLRESNDLYAMVLNKLVSYYIFVESKTPNMCPILLQRIINDGRRVLEICIIPELKMEDENSLKLWIQTYLCRRDNCQSQLKDHIKKIAKITDSELDKIYSDNSLGLYINKADEKAKAKYGCGAKCTVEFIANLQYTELKVTSDPPDEIKDQAADTVSSWDPIEFPAPIEIKHFQNKQNCPDEDCNRQSNEAILALYGNGMEEYTSKGSKEVYYRILLEKIYTLFINGINNSKYSQEINIKNPKNYFSILDSLFTKGVFNDLIYTKYQASSIIFGNNDEDNSFIELLQKGNPYDYFNPNATRTTGFNIGKKDEIKVDNYLIDSIQSENHTLRAIKKINNLPSVSIIKEEYSPIKNDLVTLFAPLYSNYTLNETNWISDGFQYSSTLDVIYYYDELSSRILEFSYNKRRNYNGLTCFEYVLNRDIGLKIGDERDIQIKNYGEASQRFNKPFVVSTPHEEFSYEIKNKESDLDSFICLDPYSNMVLESNMTLIYSIYTKNYNHLYKNIEGNQTIPLISYQRLYSMKKESYISAFEGVTGYNTGRIILIALGVVFIAALVSLCVFFWWKDTKTSKDSRLTTNAGNVNEVLIQSKFNDSA